MARVMAMLAGGGELEGVRVLSEAGRDNAIAEPVNSSTRNHEVCQPSRNNMSGYSDSLRLTCGLWLSSYRGSWIRCRWW